MLSVVVVALLASAFAQDGVDAHGFVLAPSAGGPLDRLATWRASPAEAGDVAIGGVLEYAARPLVRTSVDSDGIVTRTPLVDDLVGLNLGARYAVSPVVAVALAGPIWFTSVGPGGVAGPTLGDLRLAVPVTALAPESGFTLAIVPFADLPTGADARLLGSRSFGGGGLVAPGLRAGALAIDLNLGARAGAPVDLMNVRASGNHLLASLAVGVEATDAVGFGVEAVARPPLSPATIGGTGFPAEAIGSARGRTGGLTWTVGASAGLTRGATAAAFRVFAGAGWSTPEREPVVAPEPAVEPEPVPILPGTVRIVARTSDGKPVDARVTFDGPTAIEPLPIGADGEEIVQLEPGSWRLLASADTFGTERADLVIAPGQRSTVLVELVLEPAQAEIRAEEIVLRDVNFDFDDDRVAASSMPLLEEVANLLLVHPELVLVEVQGHTDDVGSDDYNLDLSQRRMDNVVAWLVSRGVARERLVARGYGESVPVAPNTSEEDRAKNRRVQFVIVEQSPAGGER